MRKSGVSNDRWRVAAQRPTREDVLAEAIAAMAYRVAEQTRAIIEAGALEDVEAERLTYLDGTPR